jgi:trehalose 6-phosphate synthase/phosphatase
MSRLLLVSNRLPLTVRASNGVAVAPSSGGLVAGLRGPHERSGGTWIGWPGDVSHLTEAQRSRLDRELADVRCVPVYLTPEEVSRYYDGFSNAVLWPLFHYLLDRIPPTSQDWDAYRAVNERFAEATARAWRPGDVVWVHDYQLVLVPQLVRQRVPHARIGFFLHIPFPASEVLRILPWREQVLEGMLGADLVGFHTHSYRSHFSSSVLRILGIPTRGEDIYVDGRQIRLGVFPIGVDAHAFCQLADDPEVRREADALREEHRGQKILLGIDRLDYTKGIPWRLLAFERLLEQEPRWREKVRLVQIAVPSRDNVPSYQVFRRQVDELVGRIEGAFSTVDWMPIHYVHRSLDMRQVVALYRAADVMLVTPLRDGMNLVAKEFVTCRTDEDGVLVLSELAGAAAEMGEALQVNPYDIEGMAQAFGMALTMPDEERRLRMRSLRHRIAARDVHHWAQSFVDALEAAAPVATSQVVLSSMDDLEALAARMRSADHLLLLLDYDGTLVPFARSPELAAPDGELRDLLAALAAKPGARVHVVSGRRRDTLERWLGDLPLGLHAEHGYWSRAARGEPWVGTDASVVEDAPHRGHPRDDGNAGRARGDEDGEPGLALAHGGSGARRRTCRGAVAAPRGRHEGAARGARARREGDRGEAARREQGERRAPRPGSVGLAGGRASSTDEPAAHDRRDGRRRDRRRSVPRAPRRGHRHQRRLPPERGALPGGQTARGAGAARQPGGPSLSRRSNWRSGFFRRSRTSRVRCRTRIGLDATLRVLRLPHDDPRRAGRVSRRRDGRCVRYVGGRIRGPPRQRFRASPQRRRVRRGVQQRSFARRRRPRRRRADGERRCRQRRRGGRAVGQCRLRAQQQVVHRPSRRHALRPRTRRLPQRTGVRQRHLRSGDQQAGRVRLRGGAGRLPHRGDVQGGRLRRSGHACRRIQLEVGRRDGALLRRQGHRDHDGQRLRRVRHRVQRLERRVVPVLRADVLLPRLRGQRCLLVALLLAVVHPQLVRRERLRRQLLGAVLPARHPLRERRRGDQRLLLVLVAFQRSRLRSGVRATPRRSRPGALRMCAAPCRPRRAV